MTPLPRKLSMMPGSMSTERRRHRGRPTVVPWPWCSCCKLYADAARQETGRQEAQAWKLQAKPLLLQQQQMQMYWQ